jgi:hypothetical protein
MTEDEATLFQYCVEPGCCWTAKWEGGPAADDPALSHLKQHTNHTVRSGAHLGHFRLMKLQQQGKMDHSRTTDPDEWRDEDYPDSEGHD